MNCPDCGQSLAYHDHDGCERLRSTPEIDAKAYETDRGDMVVSVNLARQICFQRNEARAELAQYRAAAKTLAEQDFGEAGWNEQCNQAAILLRNLLKKP